MEKSLTLLTILKKYNVTKLGAIALQYCYYNIEKLEAIKIKSDNFTRSNREKFNIAIIILKNYDAIKIKSDSFARSNKEKFNIEKFTIRHH